MLRRGEVKDKGRAGVGRREEGAGEDQGVDERLFASCIVLHQHPARRSWCSFSSDDVIETRGSGVLLDCFHLGSKAVTRLLVHPTPQEQRHPGVLHGRGGRRETRLQAGRTLRNVLSYTEISFAHPPP
eukprot:486425-Hanusia_phi.AAC.2